MALFKSIQQSDGVTTNYHRILYLNIVTNSCNNIAVMSYTDADARTKEQNGVIAQPYHTAVTYVSDYDPDMTVSAAYEYLKTLSQFADAEDV